MRLIDADKLHYHRVWIASIKKGEYNGMKSAVVVFADEIDKNKKARVDAADVEPVRHGRWIAYGLEERLTVHEMIDAIKGNYPPQQYAMLRESLDHALELMEAESEGRLLVLPEQPKEDDE